MLLSIFFNYLYPEPVVSNFQLSFQNVGQSCWWSSLASMVFLNLRSLFFMFTFVRFHLSYLFSLTSWTSDLCLICSECLGSLFTPYWQISASVSTIQLNIFELAIRTDYRLFFWVLVYSCDGFRSILTISSRMFFVF